ncbi:aldo/keto reductase [Dinoroseobacter sp. S76]|uniref:aldo/keto reductase n=1 Tax=Dinoroseobacter sp. S76 TaxID=3415124 RepID=UPI003C7B4A2B
MTRPDETDLGQLRISRALTGLWQVADMEKDGTVLDPETSADHLAAYHAAGFTSFDMADHYGSAEIIAGRLLARQPEPPTMVATKWCPSPGPMTAEIVRAGVMERLERLGVEQVDLLQFHWWSFEHPAWLDALHQLAALRREGLIAEIGVTNFDAAHLRVAVADGVQLVSNQVSFSLLDRRAAGPLAETCADLGVRLLAYGTLCGGFLSERWLDQPEPAEITDWSKMKYHRFIAAAGGWDGFQGILRAARTVADRHGVSIPNVATRWVLEQPHVAGVIIGARLGERAHIADNARLFDFTLSAADHAVLEAAFKGTEMVPGDCGDEYRVPPFLTASGDLSHHLSEMPRAVRASDGLRGPHVVTGTKWEDIAGYARARRDGGIVSISGTTATAGSDRVVAPEDAGAQTTFILDRIAASLAALGGSMEDVIRTRIYITDPADVDAISEAHGRVFGAIKPANTLVVVAGLIGGYRVEIDADARIAQD